MATVIRTDLWLCVDCTLYAVNGELETGIAEQDAMVKAAVDSMPWLTPDFDSETGEGIKEFAWTPCDCCHVRLGGQRHRFVQLTD